MTAQNEYKRWVGVTLWVLAVLLMLSAAAYQRLTGPTYRLRGEYEAAEGLYRESLQTKEDLGDRRGVAVTLHNLALLQHEQGRTEDALEILARSRDINIALGLDKDVATVERAITDISDRAPA